MSIVTVKRPPRADPPRLPDDQVELQEPPVMAEPAQPDLRAFLMVIPMGLGMGGMFLIFGMTNRSPAMYVMGILMAGGMVAMGAMQMGRNAAERKTKMRSERRDFLRYIAQIRKKARQAAQEQRQAVLWNNPDPSALWSVAMGSRIWERRASHDDFGRVRIGLGRQGSSVQYMAPATKPIEDLEPLSSISLRRFSEAYRTVAGVPIAVGLRSFTSVELEGDTAASLGLARAMLAQLVTFHAPDELRIAVLCGDSVREAQWDWVKWLPHNAHPSAEDEAGPVRLFAKDHDELIQLLGPDVTDRGDHDKSVPPSVAEPLVVVVAHHTAIPDGSRLLGAGMRNVVLLDLTNLLPGGPRVLRLTLTDDGEVEFPTGSGTGLAHRDDLGIAEADTLARVLAPKRTSGTLEILDEPMTSDFELTTLLGIRDPHTFDVAALWRSRQAQRARLQVPIGVTEDGEVVELDLKESAQGGMGPHGLLIGATGSGKSELLRTLVCALAMTHSSEILNLVLVDFKGGATFLGMEKLPHTSAVITNLADELPLVDRMQDALNGEMTRRQELLRASGHASLFDYEKARAAGAPLAPFPVLLLVVDEFSELLSSKAEFMDLFVSIGRLGRSLGVHLLLASQRLDEGRINRVEGHLSYRVALRTFSSMESRSVIGVGSAYELPSEPGNGFLKVDVTSLIRFKAAYVSGAYERTKPVEVGEERRRALVEVVPFTTTKVRASRDRPVPAAAEPEPVTEPGQRSDAPRLMDILIDRLVGSGPPARQVWLPPLAEAPSLDSLLPSIVPDPLRGMSVEAAQMHGRLRVPVGVVDRPSEQLRDLLIADLSGADGHIGIAGAPKSGKSTLLRTLVLSLALTHTPEEVQIYGLDFGGGGIMSLIGLPHVGSIATRMERDRVVRTIQEIRLVLERREAAFAEHGFESIGAYLAARAQGRVSDPHGHVFLVVDGWFTMKQDFGELDTAFGELAARGLSFGIHVIVTANRWSEVRTWVRDLLGTKLELRLGDSMESEFGSRRAALVPANQPGRGITADGLHFLGALPRLDGSTATDDLQDATKAMIEEIGTFWPGPAAPPVRLLPSHLPASQLPAPEPEFTVALGLDEQRLEPVRHDFMVTPHLLVLGDNETGKTNMLRLVLRAIQQRYSPEQAKVVIGDSRRDLDNAIPAGYQVGYAMTGAHLAELAKQAAVSMSRRMPGADITSARLRKRDWWQGPELFVVVDDYEMLANSGGMGSVLDPLLPMVAQGAHIGFHLVIARSTSGAMRAMMEPAIRRMWELGTPVTLLSYPKEEGRFLGEAGPRKLPPGRAQLVTRRNVRLIQTGEVDTADSPRLTVASMAGGEALS